MPSILGIFITKKVVDPKLEEWTGLCIATIHEKYYILQAVLNGFARFNPNLGYYINRRCHAARVVYDFSGDHFFAIGAQLCSLRMSWRLRGPCE
jgi:hypothetical protein